MIEKWKNEFEKYGLEAKDKLTVKLLEELSEKLSRIIELLEGQGKIRPG